MPRFLKQADRAPVPTDPEVQKVVADILADVSERGVEAVRSYSQELDRWSPERFTLTEKEIERATAAVPRELRDHIDRAAEQIRLFATAQRETLSEVEIEPSPGVVLGHRLVPISSVGAYSPGGRYPLIASSLMTTVVPKVAGVERVIACAPPQRGEAVGAADAEDLIGPAAGHRVDHRRRDPLGRERRRAGDHPLDAGHLGDDGGHQR